MITRPAVIAEPWHFPQEAQAQAQLEETVCAICCSVSCSRRQEWPPPSWSLGSSLKSDKMPLAKMAKSGRHLADERLPHGLPVHQFADDHGMDRSTDHGLFLEHTAVHSCTINSIIQLCHSCVHSAVKFRSP